MEILPEGKRKIRFALLGFGTCIAWAIVESFISLDRQLLHLSLSFLAGYIGLEGSADIIERSKINVVEVRDRKKSK